MRNVLCHLHNGTCNPAPSAVATYFGSDQPRITVEASLPWQALGVDGPPRGGMHMMLAATAWHRARWMSMCGLPPEEAMRDPTTWGVVTLGKPVHPPNSRLRSPEGVVLQWALSAHHVLHQEVLSWCVTHNDDPLDPM
jgi:hypothetical protein